MPYTQLSKPLFPASVTNLGGICVDGIVVTMDANNTLRIHKDSLLEGAGNNSIQVGSGGGATNSSDVAIGYYATATGGVIGQSIAPAIAIGQMATATGPNNIQLGHGTNADASPSLYVGGNAANYKLLDLSTGLIPSVRLPVADTTTPGAMKPDGTTITISNGVIAAADQTNGVKNSVNSGKYLKINSLGEIVAEELPTYNGGVV